MKRTHRDDLSPEVLEQLQGMFPGYSIRCAGDAPTGSLPEHVTAMMEALEQKHRQSIINGTCIDCESPMPGYNPDDDDWEPAEGWRWFTQGEGEDSEIVAWQCPACDAAES